jgi:hypothetical protein
VGGRRDRRDPERAVREADDPRGLTRLETAVDTALTPATRASSPAAPPPAAASAPDIVQIEADRVPELVRRAKLTRGEAYGLASMAVSFRITEVVDVNQGVRAMIPRDIFAPELRQTIRVA